MVDQSSSPLVRDLMTVGVATVPPEAHVADISKLLLERNLEAVIVLDPDSGHALGMISQNELVKAFDRPDVQKLNAEDVMDDAIPQVPADIPLGTAAKIMLDRGVRALFLMHHSGGIEYPAALITFRHLIRYLAARNDADLHDLGINASRQSPLEAFIERRDAARREATRKRNG